MAVALFIAMSDGPCVHMLSRFSISQISGQFPGPKNRKMNLPFKMAQALLVMLFIQVNYLAISVIRPRHFPYGWLDSSHILLDDKTYAFWHNPVSLYVQELLQITCALYI